jgi:hypothetical protein
MESSEEKRSERRPRERPSKSDFLTDRKCLFHFSNRTRLAIKSTVYSDSLFSLFELSIRVHSLCSALFAALVVADLLMKVCGHFEFA